LLELKQGMEENDIFKAGYVYNLVVWLDGNKESTKQTYRIMEKDIVYIEPVLTLKYDTQIIPNYSITNTRKNENLLIEASHRSGIEHIVYQIGKDGEKHYVTGSSVVISNLDKLPIGEHDLYVRAVSSSSEETQGEQGFEFWEMYTFIVSEEEPKFWALDTFTMSRNEHIIKN